MFEGKVALVTGGSAGIGLAVARGFVAGGGRVALVARTEARLREAVESLGGEAKAVAFPLDVSDLEALEALPQRVIDRLGGLDVVVNNAGVNRRGPIMRFTARELAEVITTNLTAPVVLTRAAAPLVREGGVFVHVSSLAGLVPVPHYAAYSASKAGLRAFSRSANAELRERGVRSCVVSPGPVDTGFFGDISQVPDIVFSQPMSTAKEVAEGVLRCIREDHVEIAVPWAAGKLATLGYLSPRLQKLLQPILAKRGAAKKRAYIQSKAR